MRKEIHELAHDIQTYKAEEYADLDGSVSITKEGMQEKYDRIKEVYDTITNRELETLWYIRNLWGGAGFNFYSVAKANYDALQSFYALQQYERQEG